jgi:plastocyanin
MRRLPALSLTLLAVLALAACSASAAPGWTYAPAPSASAAASGAASGSPSGAPSAAPSTAPSVAPSVAASASAGASASATASGGAGTTLTVTAPTGAAGTGFDPKALEAPANTAFTIHFDNQDSQPHNVQVKGAAGEVKLGGDTAFFMGPGTRDYAVPALPAGAYTFYCVVHPGTMTGTLTIK